MPRGIFIRTEQYREKLRRAAMGRIFPPEVRLKISLANKGTKPAPHTIAASIKARKGKPSPLRGRKRLDISGTNNHKWKGNNASYYAIHIWVNSHLIDPKKCEHCGAIYNLQWSNKNHKYKRNPDDWQRLCAKCHRRYDDRFFLKRIPWNKGLKGMYRVSEETKRKMRGRIPWNKNRIERKCIRCGGEFTVNLYKIKEGKGKYCSVKCYRNNKKF